MSLTPPSTRTRSPESFELLDKLGEGGMGQVYKALDTLNQEVVAVKFLLPGADSGMLERLRVEAKEHSALKHPHVVQLLDFLSYDGHDFLVMEYLDGGNLRDFLAEPRSLSIILDLFSQICDGLDYIHRQGLVHRDLKPENLLLNQQGQVKIADLGMVRRLDQDRGLTSMGQLVGSTRFMAPEQILRSQASPSADLYSLGVALFEAITASLPFEGNSDFAILNAHIRETAPSLASRGAKVPECLEELVASLLEKSPENRPRSAGQVRTQLLDCKAALEGGSSEQPSSTPEVSGTSQDQLVQVIGAISQPFRNALNGVLGMTHLLNSTRLSPEQKAYLTDLEESAQSLRGSFSDLLDFSKLKAGSLRLQPVSTDLRGLMQNLIEGVRSQAVQQRTQLFSHVDVSIPDSVLVDPLRLQQILSNLLQHCLRSAPRGQVSLLLQRDHTEGNAVALHFTVSDSSTWLTPAQLRQLFEPSAAGLSLFLAQQLSEAMQGRLWTQSEEGRGTTYHLCLTCESCGPTPPPRESRPLKILLADDQLVNQTLVKALLTGKGHQVVAVFNGLEVLQKLREDSYDLILMDMMMPEMDGLTATRQIRQEEKFDGPRQAIIALTAMDQDALPDDQDQLFEEVLAKPIQMPALLSALARCQASQLAPVTLLPYDYNELLRRVAGSQRHADMMLQVFRETQQAQLDELEQAFRGGGLEKVRQCAANLVTNLQGICAHPAARAAQTLEQLANEGRGETALHARRELLAEIERLNLELSGVAN